MFKSKRLDPETIISASDSELIRLGVTTIGNCIRLCDLYKEHITGSRSPGTSGLTARTAREERLAQFNPRSINIRRRLGSSSRDNKKKKTSTSNRSWTVQFVCLADRFATKPPASVEKQILYKAGLGLKKIKLEVEDNKTEVTIQWDLFD